MNKLVITFVLLKLSSNMMLGLFDYAMEQVETVIPKVVIENTKTSNSDEVQSKTRFLSVDR